MRINKFLSLHTDLSRRKADGAVASRKVYIDEHLAMPGDQVGPENTVYLDGRKVVPTIENQIVILLNKPVGYVCSHDGQGSKTIYDLLPPKYAKLNSAGRLDKDSSGLVILTNDGDLLNELSHPSNSKDKVYEITLEKPLSINDLRKIKNGVDIDDRRLSTFAYVGMKDEASNSYIVTLEEGRNRQIRRTIKALDNEVLELHRTAHGEYELGDIESGKFNEA